MDLKDLFCITQSIYEEGIKGGEYIMTFRQFESGFVRERWPGEKRRSPKNTIFGKQYTATYVPLNGSMVAHIFTFPESEEEALSLDARERERRGI